MREFEKQAQDFLDKTKTEFSFKFLRYGKYFDDDTSKRDIYEITLLKEDREYKFEFGQSVAQSIRFKNLRTGEREDKYKGSHTQRNKEFSEPTAYDILTCLTKYHPGSFEDFCDDFGYDLDSRKAEGIYEKVKDEYNNLERLYAQNELELMMEIE